MSEPEQAKAKRVRDVVVDAYIKLICPEADHQFKRGMEKYVAALEQAAEDIGSFLKDHRSHRDVWLKVTRHRQDQCSACHAEWEPFTEDGVTYCANCGAEVEADDEQADGVR